ncbi:MAG: CvpA family protein [Rickettsiales bacterium]|nr:CvpA family protein [Rickettsiales bacterium]
MVETSFNIFDLIVISVVGLSAMLSFFRGFVTELLSLGAWVGASIVTLYAFPDVAAHIKPHVASDVISSGLAAMGTFLGALISISIFNSFLMRFVRRGKDVGMLDNMLGFCFGVIRAAMLLSLGYFIFSLVMSEKDFPEWLATSKTRPYVESGAVLLARLAPEYLDDISPLAADKEETTELERALDVELKTDDQPMKGTDGFEWMDVDELEQMIEETE